MVQVWFLKGVKMFRFGDFLVCMSLFCFFFVFVFRFFLFFSFGNLELLFVSLGDFFGAEIQTYSVFRWVCLF